MARIFGKLVLVRGQQGLKLSYFFAGRFKNENISEKYPISFLY
jgi:hypothetical protein